MAIYVPIVMYGLGLFIVLLYNNLLNFLHVGMIRVRDFYHFTKSH